MLVELSVMEQWYRAVLAVVQDGWKVTEVAARLASRTRYLRGRRLHHQATSKAVCQVLAAALARCGIPDEILTDSGKCFTGRFGLQPVEVLFDRICREKALPTVTRPSLAHHHRQDRAIPPVSTRHNIVARSARAAPRDAREPSRVIPDSARNVRLGAQAGAEVSPTSGANTSAVGGTRRRWMNPRIVRIAITPARMKEMMPAMKAIRPNVQNA